MLNYWRTTGVAGGGAASFFTGKSTAASNRLTSSDYGYDGPFFDLEFTLSNHINDNDIASESYDTESGSGELPESDEELREIELNSDVVDRDLEISPFYEGRFLPIPPPSSNFSNTLEEIPKFPVSLLKSAARFPVLLLKLKKPDSSNGILEKSEKIDALRVKFKVDAVKGPLISLFARDYTISEQNSATNSAYLGKEMMQKYLNILKPLYVGVEKIKNSGQLRFVSGGVSSTPETAKARWRSNNLQAGYKVVRKHLRKSRSASTAATKAVSPPAKVGSHRRDDSMVQDGIRGAILHCKRSFNSNREGELSGCDPYCEKSVVSSCASSYTVKVVETRV